MLAATAALTLSLLLALLMRRAAAATRHAVLLAGLAAALAMPLVPRIAPRIEVRTVRRPMLSAALRAQDDWTAAPQRALGWRTVWAVGALLIAGARAVAYARAWRVFARATGKSRLRTTSELRQPATFAGVILLPAESDAWSAEKLRAVLQHERAHIRRHDQAAQLLADAACAVYWFHPLAWLAGRWAALERERACDDAVLAAGIEPAAYAATLLQVARHAASVAPAMAERTHLGRRIEAILNEREVRRPKFGYVAAVLVFAAIPLAALSDQREPDLLGNPIASPFSERLDQPIALRDVPIAGADAELIAILRHEASRPAQSRVDLVPERARWALAIARNGEVITPALRAMHDSDWRIRTYAAWTLGAARSTRATEALLDQLKEDNWRVRAMASTALAEIADPRAVKEMREALDDPAWQVRVEAVRYFGAVGRPQEVAHMTNDRHIAVRVAAEEGLR